MRPVGVGPQSSTPRRRDEETTASDQETTVTSQRQRTVLPLPLAVQATGALMAQRPASLSAWVLPEHPGGAQRTDRRADRRSARLDLEVEIAAPSAACT